MYDVCVFQVFGRGGEEMDFLQKQGIQVTIIPGMIRTSFSHEIISF